MSLSACKFNRSADAHESNKTKRTTATTKINKNKERNIKKEKKKEQTMTWMTPFVMTLLWQTWSRDALSASALSFFDEGKTEYFGKFCYRHPRNVRE